MRMHTCTILLKFDFFLRRFSYAVHIEILSQILKVLPNTVTVTLAILYNYT